MADQQNKGGLNPPFGSPVYSQGVPNMQSQPQQVSEQRFQGFPQSPQGFPPKSVSGLPPQSFPSPPISGGQPRFPGPPAGTQTFPPRTSVDPRMTNPGFGPPASASGGNVNGFSKASGPSPAGGSPFSVNNGSGPPVRPVGGNVNSLPNGPQNVQSPYSNTPSRPQYNPAGTQPLPGNVRPVGVASPDNQGPVPMFNQQMPRMAHPGTPRPNLGPGPTPQQRPGPPLQGSRPPGPGITPPRMAGPPPLGTYPPGPGMTTPQRMPGPPQVSTPSGPATSTPQRMPGPPQVSTPSGPATSPQPNTPEQQGRPNELPIPYHGQGQYSHQVREDTLTALTPGNSEPSSSRSSRSSTPIGNQQFDALESQFTPSPQPMQPPPPLGQGVPPRPSGPADSRRQYPAMPADAGFAPSPAPGQPMTGQPSYATTPQQPMTGQPPYQAPPQQPPFSGTGFTGSPPGSNPTYNSAGGGQVGGGNYSQPPIAGSGNTAGVPSGQMPPMPNSMNNVTSNFGKMGIQQDSIRMVNLLQEHKLLPPEGLETVKPQLQYDFKKANCSPDVFRCTLNAIPQTAALLQKARLPLGILIHPFKDLSQLPVIQSSVIVRCRSCRTYINPFVHFADQRRWKCNLCYRVNELPEEFSFDPVSKTYGEPQRRPEIRSATIEFIAPSEYMLRPPQPAVYLYLLDVSFSARDTGYLSVFCNALLEELDKIHGDSRTQIGFLAYGRSLHFFNLAEGLSQPQMLTVSDLDDVFLPCPDNLLVNLHESKDLIIDLINQLPTLFDDNMEPGSALGAALQAAYKMMCPTGGRITILQTCLPSVGPGALQSREESNERTSKKIAHLGPATDFYKKMALDCSAQQIAVDFFMLNSQYLDIATLACASKFSGGCLHYYPSFHSIKLPSAVEQFESDLRRYLTRKIGFEAVMRIRCTKGLSIHTFHGNFFVRSTDLLSLPNINPDAGFGMQMSIEESLTDLSTVCFQAALLYTSSKGERRIRVHTLCVPITNQISEVYAQADQQGIVALLSKMAADRSISSSLSDARDALINAAVDALSGYSHSITESQRIGTLPCPYSLRMLPLYVLAMIKSMAFRTGTSTSLDDRVFSMEQCKTMPLMYLLLRFYPSLYPIHELGDQKCINHDDVSIPQPPLLQLCSSQFSRSGAFILDTGNHIYMMVGGAISTEFCQDVLDKPHYAAIPEGMTDLPELDNPTSEKVRLFINHLFDNRPNGTSFLVLKEDSKNRHLVFSRMVEDRSESTMSYQEFLQHIQKQIK